MDSCLGRIGMGDPAQRSRHIGMAGLCAMTCLGQGGTIFLHGQQRIALLEIGQRFSAKAAGFVDSVCPCSIASKRISS